MTKQKLKIYYCKVIYCSKVIDKNIIMYENSDFKRDIYVFKFTAFSSLPYINKQVKDNYKLNDFVFKNRCTPSLSSLLIELKFNEVCNLYDQIKGGWVPSYVSSDELKCLKLSLELLEQIMINWNE
jgi:hypothetical protein